MSSESEPPVRTEASPTVTIYTIGHSTHPLDKFLELLLAHHITAIADVRSTPYSRRHPQFNRDRLRDALGAAGIEYVFLGKELGARSDDDACYREDKVQYDRLARSPAFASGIARLLEGAKKYRIALLCAEHEPLNCHRTILVARHLAAAGARIFHILRDGSVEPHERTLERLLGAHKLERGTDPSGHDLFGTPRVLIEEAYDRQGQRIAYRRSPG